MFLLIEVGFSLTSYEFKGAIILYVRSANVQAPYLLIKDIYLYFIRYRYCPCITYMYKLVCPSTLDKNDLNLFSKNRYPKLLVA